MPKDRIVPLITTLFLMLPAIKFSVGVGTSAISLLGSIAIAGGGMILRHQLTGNLDSNGPGYYQSYAHHYAGMLCSQRNKGLSYK